VVPAQFEDVHTGKADITEAIPLDEMAFHGGIDGSPQCAARMTTLSGDVLYLLALSGLDRFVGASERLHGAFHTLKERYPDALCLAPIHFATNREIPYSHELEHVFWLLENALMIEVGRAPNPRLLVLSRGAREEVLAEAGHGSQQARDLAMCLRQELMVRD
jgi:hypothetical protein